MLEAIDAREAVSIDNNQCPDCGYIGRFLIGPSGGMNTNVRCPSCDAGFNVVLGMRGLFGKERIARPDPAKVARAKSLAQSSNALQRLPDHVIEEMRPIFANTRILGQDLETLDRESLMAAVIIMSRAQPLVHSL